MAASLAVLRQDASVTSVCEEYVRHNGNAFFRSSVPGFPNRRAEFGLNALYQEFFLHALYK